jgi:hypothetical protein
VAPDGDGPPADGAGDGAGDSWLAALASGIEAVDAAEAGVEELSSTWYLLLAAVTGPSSFPPHPATVSAATATTRPVNRTWLVNRLLLDPVRKTLAMNACSLNWEREGEPLLEAEVRKLGRL